MPVDDDMMHEHFFYVMDNFQKLADKVDELEQNMAMVLAVVAIIIREQEEGTEDA